MLLVTIRNMNVIKYKNIFFTISGLLVAAALVSMFVFGLTFGIEFAGGTLVESSFETERPAKEEVSGELTALFPELSFTLQETGEEGYVMRSEFLDEETQTAVLGVFEGVGGSIDRVASIGPSIGSELRSKAIVAVLVVVLIIIFFVAYAFRKVSKPVSSWRYGFVAILALIHDILIPMGAFAILGHFFGYEVDVLFVMALLAILGYSVNDTIVVFDRIRENLTINTEKKIKEPFREVVGRSLKQTFARSLNTSLTTILVLVALYIFGAPATEHFALTLLIGAIAGTYSSIFLASPLLVLLGEKTKDK